MKTILQYGAYPTILLVCVSLHMWLQGLGVGIQFSSYASVILGAVLVTILEQQFPNRKAWLPDQVDIVQDATFMLLIQAVLPKLFTFSVVVMLAMYVDVHQLSVTGWWPMEWSIPAQMLLMMVMADGFRYWLHRFSHEQEFLWRFHAVHHAPHKLYWLNVGRFHPVDKALQFLFDALPFIVLGVSEEVLGLYFVCYAVNGFFQHCNIDVRLGFLNYVISGPELHRWHHSMHKAESNQNYGNNLIVWDLLFGTRFLPSDRQVGELGLINRQYPTGFLSQMCTPFIAGADKQMR